MREARAGSAARDAEAARPWPISSLFPRRRQPADVHDIGRVIEHGSRMDSSIRGSAPVADRQIEIADGSSTHDVALSERLDDARARLNLVGRLGRVSLWEFAPELGTIQSDPALFRQLGLGPGAQVTLTEWLSRVHPGDRAQVTRHIDEILANNIDPAPTVIPDERIEYRARSASGEWRWFTQASAVVGARLGMPHLAAVVADVTDTIR